MGDNSSHLPEDKIVIEEKLTPAEITFERWRRTAGLFIAPLIFLLLLCFPFLGLASPAHRLLAILGLVVTLWVTEAIPIPAAALLAAVLCVVLGVGSDKEVLAHFAHPIVFLFIGSFIIAEAMKVHRLDRRFAYAILSVSRVGNSSYRILFAIGLISACLSMWISNTATTAMLFPIALGILKALEEIEARTSFERLGTGMMLLVAYAGSIGGYRHVGGAPPNLIGIGMIESLIGKSISFFEWVTFALPITLTMFMVLFLLIVLLHPPEKKRLSGIRDYIKERRKELGSWKRGEKNALAAFLIAVSLWILPGLFAVLGKRFSLHLEFSKSHLPEAIVALLAALTLFVLPTDWRKREFTISWKQAARIDWGTILLFGGD